MVNNFTDSNTSEVLYILKEHPEGLSITDLAALTSLNRNTVSKYLGILQRQGSVDIRRVGAARIYLPTRRIPVAAIRRFCSSNLIVIDHNLEILEVSGTLTALIGTTPETLIGKPIYVMFPGRDPSDELISLLRRALRGEEGTFLWHLPVAGGATCRISLIPAVLESGRPAVSLVIEKFPVEKSPEEAHPLEALREEALREDQTEGIVRVSPDGYVRWTNEVYCRISGKTREENAGRPFRPPYTAGGGAAWREFVRSLTPNSPTATIDCELVVPAEGVRWYRWKGRALCNADGRVFEYQFLCFAIHECRMIEDSLRRDQLRLEEQLNKRTAALRESEERFRAIFEESPLGIAFCDMNGTLVRMNRMFLGILGIQNRKDIEGRSLSANLDIPSETLSRLQKGEVVRFTVPSSWKQNPCFDRGTSGGTERIYLEGAASPIPGEDGAPSGFVLHLCDVTGREEAAAATREARLRTRDLLDILTEGVVYLGADGRVIDANPAAERILGHASSEMRGRTCSEFRERVIDKDGSECPEDRFPHIRALTAGIPERSILNVFNPREKRRRWLDILAVPRFRPGEEEPFQAVVVFSDITGQREREKMHSETERRYRTLTESLPDVTFLLDQEGHVLYVNSLGVRMLHRTSEEIIGREVSDLFPGDPGAEYRRNVASVAATGVIKDNISRLQLPGGEVWYDTRLIPVRAEDGTCRYVMGIARDVTARMRAEETSRKNAERFRSVFEESPIGIAICDPAGLPLHANRACLELFGIARAGDLRGTNLLQIYRETENGDAQLPDGAGASFECRVDFDLIRKRDLLPTARTGSIHISGVISPLGPPEGGSPEGYLLQMLDVTDRVLAEGALRESHDMLAGIARHLPDAMFAIDRKGAVTIWNLAMEALTGIPAEEMLGKGGHEYALPFYGERIPMLVDKVLNPEETLRNRYRSVTYAEENDITAETVLSPNSFNPPRLWWVKAAPLYDGQGKIAGAIESIRDITEQRRGEEILKRERSFTSTLSGVL
ncbi:PAS domain-containing protein [Methanoculleus sp.]|uniref:PAS domain-containing protein n=1 Tax=Methanoculleus sp. TaxID=90427 RepID=UPI0025CD72A6|nr:PAS domain-containing protein [Methanoculleus sp.]